MIKTVDFKKEYAEELSEIILSNLYTINIKDHGKEIIDKISANFTEEKIIENFSKRTKCIVALKDNKVVGTASLDKFRGDSTGNKYIILTVFTKIENHNQGIGKILLNEIEKYAIEIGAKEIVIPSSIHACEFYRKLGYDYTNGIKEQNEDKEYLLVKYL